VCHPIFLLIIVFLGGVTLYSHRFFFFCFLYVYCVCFFFFFAVGEITCVCGGFVCAVDNVVSVYSFMSTHCVVDVCLLVTLLTFVPSYHFVISWFCLFVFLFVCFLW